MKKTITLIMMFVLSVGFLMAQGVFTYQTVVVDNEGKLVVNKPVTATVTITDGTNTFVQNDLTGTTSANGLLLLSVGDKTSSDFNNMDWKIATIKVKYTVTGATVPTDTSRIPAVPYALQTDDSLTTAKIVEYVKGADLEDVLQILDAMDHGTPNLRDTLMGAIIDSVKENYKLAKQVFMYYVEHATAADLDTLYNALVSNTQVTAALDTILVQFLKDSTEMVYDILRQYALSLTADDVNAIIAAIPPTSSNTDNVKSYIVNKAFEYLMTPNAKKKLLIPVIMDYVKNADSSDVDAMVASITDNQNGVYDTLLNKFNSWMDYYFAHHYTGGSNNSFVQTMVNDSMDARYYTCPSTEVDLCQLKHDLDSLNNTPTCIELITTDVVFARGDDGGNDIFVATINYDGTEDFEVSVSVMLPGGGSWKEVDASIVPNTSSNPKSITITIPSSEISSIYVSKFYYTITICSICHSCPDDGIMRGGVFEED